MKYKKTSPTSGQADTSTETLVRYIRDNSGKAISMINYEDRSSNNEARTFYFIYNGHGDVTALTDNTGTVVATYSYDEFGSQLTVDGRQMTDNGIYNPLRYSGAHNAYYDSETSLYKMGTRYYQPDIARWLTRDSYKGEQEVPLTQNKYIYVENNPINRTDPTGHWSAYEPKGSPLYPYTHFRMTYEIAQDMGFRYYTDVASGARDLDNAMYAAVLYPSLHFDYQEGSGLVNDSRYQFFRRQWSTAASLVRTQPSIAAYELGRGLHSLQDRFAHGYISGWGTLLICYNVFSILCPEFDS